MIDARGLVVAPGLVDLCARMREPGAEGALRGEMRAALAGGVTGLVCPPDTDPPLDEPGLVRMLRQRSREAAGARLYPLGALTAGLAGAALAEMHTLAQVGCVAFCQTGALPANHATLLQALRYARTFDLAVWLQPVDASLVGDGVAGEGPIAARLGLPGSAWPPRRSPCTSYSSCSVPPARACTSAASPRPRASSSCAPPSARGCR